MKQLSLRMDDFLLELIKGEARRKKSTKIEVIRAAVMNYFLSQEDLRDIQIAESRTGEEDLPFERHF